MTDYSTLENRCVSEYVISRSRFISNATRCDTKEEAEAFIAEIRKKYGDATHNTYAYVASPETNDKKFSDDGEPQGTAGQPIMSVIEKRGLYSVAIVVTRYFGGIKLGSGGLVQAYRKAASDVLNTARLTDVKFSSIFEATLNYNEYKTFNSRLSNTEIVVMDTQFQDNVTVRFAVPVAFREGTERLFKELFAGQMRYEIKEEKYINYPR